MKRRNIVLLLFMSMIFTCSPGSSLKWMNNDSSSLLCRNCNSLDRLPSQVTWLQISDENCPLVPSEVFENSNLDTLIVYSKRVQYETVTRKTSLTAFAQPAMVMDEIPSFLKHSHDLKSLVIFLSNQGAAQEGISYDSLKYLMLGINSVGGELISPLLSSPVLEDLSILTQRGTVKWPENQKLPSSIISFKAPIDLSENIGLFDGLDKLETISIARISNLEEGLKYLSGLKELKVLQVHELQPEENILVHEILPYVTRGIEAIEFLPSSWQEH